MDSFIVNIDEPGPSLFLAAVPGFSISIIIEILILVVLIFCSALVSGSEVAIFSLSQDELDTCSKSELRSEKLVAKLLEKPKMLLASILISNNFINVAIVTLSTFISWQLFDPNEGGVYFLGINVVWFFDTILVAGAIVFFGEVIPKVYATQKGLDFAKRVSYVLNIINTICTPFSFILSKSTIFLEKRIQQKEYEISLQDLNQAVDMAAGDEATEEEKGILRGIVNFGSTTVKQIMHSRLDITAFNENRDFHEIMDRINKTSFSRIPVYRDTIDNIVGILYIKDLLPFLDQNEHFRWQKLLRNVYFVPESKKISDLLKSFQEKHVHMAIGVDEYGGTSGLITMEDILEEIVGEINDEFDGEEVDYTMIDERTYVFEGKTSLHDVLKIIDQSGDIFDEVKGESESLGGLLLEINMGMPHSGDEITYKNFSFKIESVNSKRIKRVRLKIHEQELNEEL